MLQQGPDGQSGMSVVATRERQLPTAIGLCALAARGSRLGGAGTRVAARSAPASTRDISDPRLVASAVVLLAHIVHLGAVGRVGYVVILATLVLVATLALLLIVEGRRLVRLATVGRPPAQRLACARGPGAGALADGGRRLAHIVHLGAVGRVGYVVILATLVLVATLALLLIVEVVVLVPSRVTVVRLATVGRPPARALAARGAGALPDGGRRLGGPNIVHLGAVGRVGYVVILATLVLVATLALLLIVEVVVLVPSRVTVVRLATVGRPPARALAARGAGALPDGGRRLGDPTSSTSEPSVASGTS